MIQAGPQVRERELYEFGPHLLAVGHPLPDLTDEETAHLLRGMWDHAGFIGRNLGGYPVASLLAPPGLASDIAAVIERVTGRRTVAKPLKSGNQWVGVSGRLCAPWLSHLYCRACVASPRKLEQVRELLEAPAL